MVLTYCFETIGTIPACRRYSYCQPFVRKTRFVCKSLIFIFNNFYFEGQFVFPFCFNFFRNIPVTQTVPMPSK